LPLEVHHFILKAHMLITMSTSFLIVVVLVYHI
jgi:hypothetical protein